jgi:hypothetical protein
MISTVEKNSWTAGRRAIGVGINITLRLEMAGQGGDARAEANDPRSN